VGGFGIDGNVSTLVGSSLVNKNSLYFGVIGDLAFFYDMNALGNRSVGNNLRILLINNGKGAEFRRFNHKAAQHGNDADKFVAAAGHFGNKSKTLVKHYAQDLGFEYLCAGTKEEFEQVYERFIYPEITDKPILFEVFTNSEDESRALEKIMKIEVDVKKKVKNTAKQVLGTKGVNAIKKAMGK
jgi:2-succinyl-5-enolpyruvyl-6-hydroxy-3-cyclohexene-1-carboxylate synthase